ncbi:MAG: family intrarane metalloprotease protein [Pseudonocardiales bacterium]|nr:family intrarane metalloprotease protein [Pseudonocardiales bacterium]
MSEPARVDRPSVLRWEVIGVLGVSFLTSGMYALLSYIRAELTVPGGISNTTAVVVSQHRTVYPWLDLLDALADLVNGIFPAVLAIALLFRSPGGRGLGVGLDWTRWRRELAQGVGFLALIGLPGLGLVYLAHLWGLNASLQVVDFPDVWYRVPYLILSAAQNGIAEEIVVIAFLITRLGQLGWSRERSILAAATLRGSYHLYQGIGGFIGNAVMGLIFGWWFTRTKRVLPLVIAHTLLDAASFVGYLYLHEHISWI